MSMPELADMLLERTRNGSWVVVFKALISTHNLLVLGNEVGMERGGAGKEVCGLTAEFLERTAGTL